MARWVSCEVMSLAYEARVAVRGELASPKSFPRLIHNNKDDRDKRRNTPRGHPPTSGQRKLSSSQRYNARTRVYLS